MGGMWWGNRMLRRQKSDVSMTHRPAAVRPSPVRWACRWSNASHPCRDRPTEQYFNSCRNPLSEGQSYPFLSLPFPSFPFLSLLFHPDCYYPPFPPLFPPIVYLLLPMLHKRLLFINDTTYYSNITYYYNK